MIFFVLTWWIINEFENKASNFKFEGRQIRNILTRHIGMDKSQNLKKAQRHEQGTETWTRLQTANLKIRNILTRHIGMDKSQNLNKAQRHGQGTETWTRHRNLNKASNFKFEGRQIRNILTAVAVLEVKAATSTVVSTSASYGGQQGLLVTWRKEN